MRTPSESATGKSAARGAGVKRRCAAAVGLLVLAGQSAANAQTLEAVVQDLQLDPGWNAVYLRVDAPVEERIRLLERAGVSTVLMQSATARSSVEDIDAVLAGEDWPEAAMWTGREIDTGDGAAVHAAAEALAAGRCYLMEAGARRRIEVRLTGPPSARVQRWRGLAGALFAAPGDDESTVGAYFEASPVLRGADAYTLAPEDGWLPVEDERPLDRNGCLFVTAPGLSRYQGPIEVSATEGQGLVFTDDATEHYLRIVNRTGEAASLTLSTPRFPQEGEGEGLPALFAWSPERAAAIASRSLPGGGPEVAENMKPWGAIDENGTAISIPGGNTLHLRVGANIPAALDWSRGAGESEGPVRSVLSVRGAGVRYELPVTIDLGPLALSGERDTALVGLWVGDVLVDRVSYAGSNGSPLMPVSEPFLFRFILHRGGDGECSVLSDAIVMQPADGARYVLTDEDAALDRVGRGETARWRVRTVAYVTDGAVGAEPGPSGNVAECLVPDSSVSFRLRLDYDHPLNPDVHGAHPDHDNLNERYEAKLPEGAEAATIERVFTISVAGRPSPREYAPDWSTARIVGNFSEAITGVHSRELRTAGRFFLRRLSDVERVEQ